MRCILTDRRRCRRRGGDCEYSFEPREVIITWRAILGEHPKRIRTFPIPSYNGRSSVEVNAVVLLHVQSSSLSCVTSSRMPLLLTTDGDTIREFFSLNIEYTAILKLNAEVKLRTVLNSSLKHTGILASFSEAVRRGERRLQKQ